MAGGSAKTGEDAYGGCGIRGSSRLRTALESLLPIHKDWHNIGESTVDDQRPGRTTNWETTCSGRRKQRCWWIPPPSNHCDTNAGGNGDWEPTTAPLMASFIFSVRWGQIYYELIFGPLKGVTLTGGRLIAMGAAGAASSYSAAAVRDMP
mmetsp:Transcript_1279/g.2288  ORF Transcript_1279/g.2288 Transcript_1279/m.2288 type:complete len:150 (+) Transcript_1279:335-784(+)